MSYVLDAGKRRPRHGRARREVARPRDRSRSSRSRAPARRRCTFDCVTIEKAAEYAAEDADVTLRLWQALQAAAGGRAASRPSTRRWSGRWSRCWRAWRGRGISIDRQVLSRLSGEFAQKQGGLEDEINKLAGAPLNPGSPKQLGDILFGKMGLPGGTKTKTGQWATGAKRARGAGRAGPRAAAQDPRLAAGLQAALDLHRRAAGLRQSGDQARPHLLRAGRDHHRPAVVVRAEPAEHPDPHRGGPQDPPRLHRRAGHASWSPPTTRRSSCGCSPRSPTSRSCSKAFRDGLDIHAMTASEMFGVPVQGHAGRGAPPRQGDQLRHHLRHLGVRPRQPARHRARGGRRLHQEILRALPRHPRLHGRDQGVRRRRTAMCSPCSAASATIPTSPRRNPSIRAFDERAAINARLQGRAADIIRRAMIRIEPALAEGEAQGADAAAGARRTDLRGAGGRGRRRPCRWSSR